MNKRSGANAIMLLAALIWGFAFVAQVDGMKYIGSFTMVGIRFFISIIALLPIILVFERKHLNKKEIFCTLRPSLLLGTVLFVASAFQQFGIQVTSSAGVSGLITGLYTIFVPMAYFLFFKRKTGIQVWIGAACAIIGLFMLCYDPDEGLKFGLGELLLLIGSFLWTAHVILIDRFVKNDIRPLLLSWGQFAVCAVLGLICMFVFEGSQLTVTSLLDAKWSLLYCGVLSSACAYTFQVLGQKNADPTYAAIILSSESAFSAIFGAVLGVDSISLIGYVGCALMFAGIVFSQLNLRSKKMSLGE